MPAICIESRQAHQALKSLVTQTLENQIRGLAVVFGIRLPRGLSPAFAEQVTNGSRGVAGLTRAIAGLVAARNAVLAAITAIDRDVRRLACASEGCRRLMTIPGIGQLTALTFVAVMDEPERFRRLRDVGAYFGLVPRLALGLSRKKATSVQEWALLAH